MVYSLGEHKDLPIKCHLFDVVTMRLFCIAIVYMLMTLHYFLTFNKIRDKVGKEILTGGDLVIHATDL